MEANRFFKLLILTSVACLIIYYYPNFNEVNQLFHADSVPVSSDPETTSATSEPSFYGEENWPEEELELCNNPDSDIIWTREDALCFIVTRGFEFSKIEIVSWSNPVLVIFRDMFTPTQVDGYSRVFKESNIQQEKVFDELGEVYISPTRVVNGSRAKGSEYEIQSILETAARLIPSINFQNTEPVVGLSYLPGGHCCTHHDFIDFDKDAPKEASLESGGNRLATLIISIEKADVGGGTVFPYLKTTVQANPGDAFMWFNLYENEENDIMSYHGGCPVREGKKLIANIFIRSKRQHILQTAEGKRRSFNARELLR